MYRRDFLAATSLAGITGLSSLAKAANNDDKKQEYYNPKQLVISLTFIKQSPNLKI